MFHAKLADASVLKKLIDVMKEVVIEVNFNFTSTGINIQAMDSSHVALINLKLSSEGFEEFRCDKEMILGIVITNLQKIMKISESGDSVTMDYNEEAHENLKILFENTKSKRSSEFELCLINIDDDPLGIPEKTYESNIEISTGTFSKICKDLSTLSDSVIIEASKDFIKFGVGSDSIKGSFKLTQNDTEDANDRCIINNDQEIKLTFAIKYLKNFSVAGSLSQSVNISLSTQFPLMLEFVLADLGSLKFYLAPKMTEDEK